MRYMLCPRCGDPVAGRLTPRLVCSNCKESFPLVESQVYSGLIVRDEKTQRWKVG
jgi:hypothetical protein